MNLQVMPERFSICEIEDIQAVDWQYPHTFVSQMEDVCTLVCPEKAIGQNAQQKRWRGFYMDDSLDTEVGSGLKKILQVLGDYQINLHLVTTFQTDYLFVPEEKLEKALLHLKRAGWSIYRK